MKNVLFVLPFLPYPLKSGGHQAIFNGIKTFINDINITIVYEEEWNEDSSQERISLENEFNGKVKIIPFKKNNPKKSQSFALKVYTRYWHIKETVKVFFGIKNFQLNEVPLQIQSRDFALFVNNIILQHNIDIVQCEMLGTIGLILTLPKHIKTIFVHHEIGFIRQAQEVESLSEEIKYLQKKNQINELFLLNRFDHIITLSKQDSQILKKFNLLPQIHTSLAIVNHKKSVSFSATNNFHLVFVGPSQHTPNVIGLNWFLSNCWSHLKQSDKRYHLSIIGEWTKKDKHQFSSHYRDIEFLGFVDNLADAIMGSIMIVPITVGSGIRMKILDAAYIGCPIVSTSVGAQGLPLKHEKDCLIADNPTDFVQKILELKNISKQLELVENALETIQKEYSHERLHASRIGLYL